MKKSLFVFFLLAAVCLSACSSQFPNSTGSTEKMISTEHTGTPSTQATIKSTESVTKPSESTHTHRFSSATCTAPKTCSCGATDGSAAGHAWKNATCTSPKKCSTCGITDGSVAEHSWKDATYTAPKTCSVCGATEGNPVDVPGKENYHGHVYTGGQYSKKYHYEADCAGTSSHEITWDEVERRKLGSCGTCVLK